MNDEKYMTLPEVAEYIGVSVRTLNRHLVAAVNPLPHFRIGNRVRWRRADVDQWVEVVGRKDRAREGTVTERAQAAVDRTYGSGDNQFGVVSGRGNRHS